MVTSFSCTAIMSRRASLAKSRVISAPVNWAVAITRLSAPSSSRTLARMRLATKKATSWGSSMPACCALLMRMATRVSSSGGSTATVRPQPKRDLSRSSRPSISLG